MVNYFYNLLVTQKMLKLILLVGFSVHIFNMPAISQHTPAHHLTSKNIVDNLYAIDFDFRVNNIDVIPDARTFSPAIAIDSDGNFVIAWVEGKGVYYHQMWSNIYAQRFSSKGNTIGSKFKVNDDINVEIYGYKYHGSPSISTSENGNFVITWHNDRNKNSEIYAQRFTSDGSAIGANFRVNDDHGGAYQWNPSIATDGSGNFVITWEEYDGICAQRFTSDGSKIGVNFIVNDDDGDTYKHNPSIATGGGGDFVITWEDRRNGDWDIYAQHFASDGSTVGTNFRVNDNVEGAWHEIPSISADSFGNFVITWEYWWTEYYVVEDEIDSCIFTDIYAQRFNSDGSTIGTNFRVNVNVESERHGTPSISTDSAGNFIITWQEYDLICAQRFTSDGSKIGVNFIVNDDDGDTYKHNPSIATGGSGDFVLTWENVRNLNNANIYAQHFASDGSPIGTNFRVNENVDREYLYQCAPSLSVADSGDFVITWEDNRNKNRDIYAQHITVDGLASGFNFIVNDDTGSAYQACPSISRGQNGKFVITWEDDRNGDDDIYAQCFDSEGTAIGTNFKVNDDPGIANQINPSVSIDQSGHFVVTWEDRRNGDDDIYAQRYVDDGTYIGANFKVNDDPGRANQWHPAISTGQSGHFVVTWEDRRNGDDDIYAQRYDSEGTTIGANFRVNDDLERMSQSVPAVTTDDSDNFVITWQDRRNGDYDIYGQRYASDGSKLGSNFRVNDDLGRVEQLSPAIAADDVANFVITWEDRRNGDYDIYGQRYASDGSKLGSNFRMTYVGESLQYEPDVKLWNGRIYNTWTDYRTGFWTDFDIYANIIEWGYPVGKSTDELIIKPSTFVLHQNYPNPFNPSTVISWQLAVSSNVELSIYNILGQKIKTLLNKPMSAGYHEVGFNGQNLSSGVYLYRIEAGGWSDVRKMVLIK